MCYSLYGCCFTLRKHDVTRIILQDGACGLMLVSVVELNLNITQQGTKMCMSTRNWNMPGIVCDIALS